MPDKAPQDVKALLKTHHEGLVVIVDRGQAGEHNLAVFAKFAENEGDTSTLIQYLQKLLTDLLERKRRGKAGSQAATQVGAPQCCGAAPAIGDSNQAATALNCL